MCTTTATIHGKVEADSTRMLAPRARKFVTAAARDERSHGVGSRRRLLVMGPGHIPWRQLFTGPDTCFFSSP